MTRTRDLPRENRRIIASLDVSVKRIQVMDEKGKTRWREVADVLDTDEILINPKTNEPYTMTTSPGRRKKATLNPINSTVAALVDQKEDAISNDELVLAVRDNPQSPQVIDLIAGGIAEEIAALEFERREAERNGQSGMAFSHKRITGLRSMADLWLKRAEQMSGKLIDIDSPAFKSLFVFLMELFKEALDEANIPSEMIQIIFNNLSQSMEDGSWKSEAKKRMGVNNV